MANGSEARIAPEMSVTVTNGQQRTVEDFTTHVFGGKCDFKTFLEQESSFFRWKDNQGAYIRLTFTVSHFAKAFTFDCTIIRGTLDKEIQWKFELYSPFSFSPSSSFFHWMFEFSWHYLHNEYNLYFIILFLYLQSLFCLHLIISSIFNAVSLVNCI